MSTSSQMVMPAGYPSGTVVLVSSGIDSTICADLEPTATRLFVDFGQAEIAQERCAARHLFPDMVEATLRANLGHAADGVFVPARNLLLACIALHYGDDVVLGAMLDDVAIDKTPVAIAAQQQILTAQAGRPITVRAPLITMLKHEAVAYYLARGGSRERIKATWSCYSPGPLRCLACKACMRWAVALRVNGIDVPLPNDEIIRGYLARLHIYEPGRQWAILNALDKPVVTVDIDGVLTDETTGHDYAHRTPRGQYALRHLARDQWVILHTSRDETDRAVTVAWLERHGFVYHGLVMNKLPAMLRVDDRARTTL